jgi:Calcineurin-like phosphoesterase
MRIRILTAADLHQSRLHYRSLNLAVKEHQPDGVALIGDFLCNAPIGKYQFPMAECARFLADLPVKHLLFVRGNHEDANWKAFVHNWPFGKRPLTALYGSAYTIGPLVIVGFPCKAGSESTWCKCLPKHGNELSTDPELSGRPCLPADTDWLSGLMRGLGPSGRVIWLMHEPPVGHPLAKNELAQPAWDRAVEQFSPSLVVSGHDHDTPLSSNQWRTEHKKSTCINVGQAEMDFHHCIIDFDFSEETPCLPRKITVHAFPQEESIEIHPQVV